MITIDKTIKPEKKWLPQIVKRIRQIPMIENFECEIMGSYADLCHGYDVYSYGSGNDIDFVLHSPLSTQQEHIRYVLNCIKYIGIVEFSSVWDVLWVQKPIDEFHKMFTEYQYDDPKFEFGVITTIKRKPGRNEDGLIEYEDHGGINPWLIEQPLDQHLEKRKKREENHEWQRRFKDHGMWARIDIHTFDIDEWERQQ